MLPVCSLKKHDHSNSKVSTKTLFGGVVADIQRDQLKSIVQDTVSQHAKVS